MNKFLALLLVSAVLFISASATVVDLTPDNFDEIVNGNEFVFIEFFAPWCGHCKSLAPVYEKFGAAFAGKPNVVIAKVDADAHKELGSRFGVSGFPTLKFFTKGEPEDYEGGRDLPDLIAYVNGKVPSASRAKVAPASPSRVVVLTPANFDAVVLDASKNVLVEFYAPWCGHCKRLAPVWESLAEVFQGDEDVVIAKVDADAHKELGTRFGVSGFPTIKYFPTENKAGEEFDGGRELKDLVEWVNTKAGTARDIAGRYLGTVGVIETLTDLGKKLLGSDESALEQARKFAATIEDRIEKTYADMYLKFFKAIKAKPSFLTAEIARISRMCEGSLAPKKLDEFSIRLNILKSIAGEVEKGKEEL